MAEALGVVWPSALSSGSSIDGGCIVGSGGGGGGIAIVPFVLRFTIADAGFCSSTSEDVTVVAGTASLSVFASLPTRFSSSSSGASGPAAMTPRSRLPRHCVNHGGSQPGGRTRTQATDARMSESPMRAISVLAFGFWGVYASHAMAVGG